MKIKKDVPNKIKMAINIKKLSIHTQGLKENQSIRSDKALNKHALTGRSLRVRPIQHTKQNSDLRIA